MDNRMVGLKTEEKVRKVNWCPLFGTKQVDDCKSTSSEFPNCTRSTGYAMITREMWYIGDWLQNHEKQLD